MPQTYSPTSALEEVIAMDLARQLGMTPRQRELAATVLYVWARIAGWAGLGRDLSNWPAGDPVELLCRNIIERSEQTSTRLRDGDFGADLPAALYGLIAAWRVDRLPSRRQAEQIEAELRAELEGDWRDAV